MITHGSDARQNEWSEWLEVLVGKAQISLGCPYLCRTLKERAEEEEHLEALRRAQGPGYVRVGCWNGDISGPGIRIARQRAC